MRTLTFGATGRTGRELVSQALRRGHDVSGFVRTPAKLTVVDPRVRVVQGNILQADSIHSAIPEHDAVLSALGAGSLGPTTLLSLREGCRPDVRDSRIQG